MVYRTTFTNFVPSEPSSVMKRYVYLIIIMAAFALPSSAGEKVSIFKKEPKGKPEYVVRYAIRLDDVSCDRNVGFRQGIKAEAFTDLDGGEDHRYRYADDVIGATWYVSDIALNFSIVNKRQAPMMIPWSSVNYRDPNRLQSGVGYTLEHTDEMMPSFVPGGTGLSGFLIPDVNYPVEGGVRKDITPLLPSRFRTRSAARRNAADQVRRTMRVHMPVFIGNTQFNYYFTFVVDKVVSITKQTVYRPEDLVLETSPAGIGFSADSLLTLPETLVKDSPLVVPKWNDIDESKKDDLARLRYLASYYNYFLRVCPRERVYLHFDNTAYFQGETIYYAAYVTDDTGLHAPASRVLYVDLLSPTGVIIKQHKLKIVGGRCHGAFQLVDTSVREAIDRRGAVNLPSGYYQIRAYTHSMLNFDDAAIFSRVIPVYQFPEREGYYDNPVVGEYPYHEIFRPQPPRQKPKGLTLSFFPEGGHLISGIPCNIAFKATDDNGLGVNIDGLRTKDGKAVTLSPQHRGMGSFEWQTDAGSEKLIATLDGKEYECTLPKAERQGCSLHLTQHDHTLIAHIDAVGMTADTLLAYTLTGRGQLCAFDTIHVAARNDTVYTPTDNGFGVTQQISTQVITYDIGISTRQVPTGVCQFTLYNPAGDILAQRTMFVDNGTATVPVTYTATKPEYKPFERIQMTFSSGMPLTFSLAVRDAADYGTAYADDIRTYMLLSSELKGLIEEPGWYFEENYKIRNEELENYKNRNEELGIIPADGAHSASSNLSPLSSNPIPNSSFLIPNSSERKSALDLLMLVQGWTRYDWQQMAGVTPFKVRHYTEQQLVLEGWAFSRITERPLSNTKVDVLLVSPERDLEQKASVTTDAEGYWSVGLQDFEGKWHLYYHTEQDKKIMKKATTRMRLERSYKPGVYAYTPLDTYLPDHKASNALLPSWREDINDFLMPHDAITLDEVEIKANVLYVDYGTFHAYDAAAACEDIFDEGDYTYKLYEYLYRIGFYGDRYGLSVYDHTVHRYIIPMAGGEVLDKHNWRMLQEDLGDGWSEGTERDITNEESSSHLGERIKKSDMEYIKSVMIYDTINYDPRVLPSFKHYANRLMIDSEYQDFLRYLYRGDKFLIAEVDYGDAAFAERRGKNERLTTFSGYTPVVEFYAPTYPNGPVQGDKDYRRTLYWNPEVTTNAEGQATISFYNNGYSRALTISAEGLTPDGTPIITPRP